MKGIKQEEEMTARKKNATFAHLLFISKALPTTSILASIHHLSFLINTHPVGVSPQKFSFQPLAVPNGQY